MPVTFSDVKQILDGAIESWKAKNGRNPDLIVHGPTFGWETREQLLAAEAFGFRLIDPSLIGAGMGDRTNLVIALRDPDGVEGLTQMPLGGPFLEQALIDKIIEWIDVGAPA